MVVIPVFVPHKGCPFDCIYCNQKIISGETEEMTEEKMRAIIEEHLSSLNYDSDVEIGFYGGSFTGIDRGLQRGLLEAANDYIKDGRVRGIRLSTRPDYIDVETLGFLKEYNVHTIELGVQSIDEEVLKVSCRGHSARDVVRASELVKQAGFTLGIQTMIGLPGDTREKDLKTAMEVVRLSPAIVRIYPTLVIRYTHLEKLFRQGQFTPLSLEDAVDICAELIELYHSEGINVIRVGLQPTENVSEKGEVVAGPFHPAFRQLAESRIMLRRIEEKIKTGKLGKSDEIIVYTGSKNISNVTGQKRSNINYLKEKYSIGRIIVKPRDDLEGYACDVIPLKHQHIACEVKQNAH